MQLLTSRHHKGDDAAESDREVFY